jgi:hypothetical protein
VTTKKAWDRLSSEGMRGGKEEEEKSKPLQMRVALRGVMVELNLNPSVRLGVRKAYCEGVTRRRVRELGRVMARQKVREARATTAA